jgi:hypothetical protein
MGGFYLRTVEDLLMMTEANWREAIEIKDEMINRRDAEITRLRAEVEHLSQELSYIAQAKKRSFEDDRKFRLWVQRRAQHALNRKPGELTVKKA